MSHLATRFTRLTAAWLALATTPWLAACQRGGIEASASRGTLTPVDDSESKTSRVFVVDSPAGLQVDAASSGLGLEIAVPQDAAATPTFELVVTLVPAEGASPLFLAMESDEVEYLERPSTVDIPLSMMPESMAAGGSALIVKDGNGVRRAIAPDALQWSDGKVSVKTSQPMGEWNFVPEEEVGSDVTDLAVAVRGLAQDESLRYEVAFRSQRFEDQSFEIRLPETVVRQKTTGDETRIIAAPVGARGSFAITVLEAPVAKTCTPSVASGLLGERVEVTIDCE